ncbi:HPP family protein [Flavobacterium sp. NKUCC04_CG]|uniref:HPP family protein n=1 Tax=Flavobacterium sp. NKUCC04_CG TaxID=2842121 RepID=UPI001C5B9658|nr:HPP family protein [Flavobacterium sp. NKUCC04_CG]MBW3519762.1 HPP family protein [Flavobacterium sp. NKUCC04_CG]
MKKNIKRTARITRYVIYKETLVDSKEHFWSFVGAFVGIGVIAYIQSFWFTQLENVFLIGSFGASSVLIYGAIDSPLAQPRNLIGGHVVSAIIGVTVAKLFPDMIYIAAPLAVSLSIVGMQMTKTIHPPGGATALIAVADTGAVKSLGYYYVFSPVLTGALILFLVALVFNNMTSNRSYPKHSKFFSKRKTKSLFKKT